MTASSPHNGHSDPFPNVPLALSWRERRRRKALNQRKREILLNELREARQTLALLRDSDRVQSWQEDVRLAQERVRDAWTAWKLAEDERIRRLIQRSREIAAVGVPRR